MCGPLCHRELAIIYTPPMICRKKIILHNGNRVIIGLNWNPLVWLLYSRYYYHSYNASREPFEENYLVVEYNCAALQ